jgi:hypothetical protein
MIGKPQLKRQDKVGFAPIVLKNSAAQLFGTLQGIRRA